MARYNYVVIGAGRQGTAAAYDLMRWGEAERVVLADADADVAQASAGRVNKALNTSIARCRTGTT
jgi:lysine 6-dehydrogenase